MARNVVLVCGSHKECDPALIYSSLDILHKDRPITLIVQGYARHTDRVAHEWARDRGIPSTGRKYAVTSTMWQKQGRGAGIIRNAEMLKKERPNLVVGFPGGPGTDNMCSTSADAGVNVIKVTKEGKFE